MTRLLRYPAGALSAVLIGAMSTHAGAGGFALNEMGAATLGNAHAGGAALADDLSTLFSNPAGLMRFQGPQAMVAASGIRLSARFDNRGSTSATGTPLGGGNGGDAGDWSLVPALYLAGDLTPDLRIGLGIQAPFGLKTDYASDWVGRYQALRSELTTVDINPSLAYRINQRWSVGAGISAQYLDVKLSKAIDFGSICLGQLGPATCAPLGYLPQARDGSVTVDGTDWGFGFNLGVLYAPDRYTRFGLAYRSPIRYRLHGGTARYQQPAGLPARLAQAAVFTDSGVTANLDLPESVRLSAYQEVDANWSLMADLSWMRWSRLKELRIRFDNGAPDSVTPENWTNTWRIGLAANYRYNDRLLLRTGVAWDESPVDDAFRTARIPDTNRTWLSFGMRYTLSPQSSLDLGYAHLFMKDASISQAEPPAGGTLTGTYRSKVDILSVQYRHLF